ncbi:unnamed protein product, partial [Sphacelaria rigidula]
TRAQVLNPRSRTLTSYDESLRKSRFREALDRSLEVGNSAVIAALLDNLMDRGGNALQMALSGRDEAGLAPVLKYITKYLTNPRHTHQLLRVTECVLDIYGDVASRSPGALALLSKLRRKVRPFH